jgi:hypothetical protein
MKRSSRFGVLIVAATAITVGFVSAETPALAAPTIFTSTAAPNTGVHNGTVITVTGNGALNSAQYYCGQLIVNQTTAVFAAKFTTVKVVTSTATGHITCQQTFHSFQAKDTKGTIRHCPLTTADASAGFVCGVGLGDKATKARTSDSLATFSAS